MKCTFYFPSSGMGASEQCNGYFPGYYSTRDPILESEGSTWTSSNVNGEQKNDCHNIGSSQVSSPCNLLGYKEHLKQTILKHEAVFRDQIHELHRVYHKQRELMEENKSNELYRHNLRLETSWSGSSLSSKNAQKICCSPSLPLSTGQSSPLIAELPLGSAKEKNTQICSFPAPTVTNESLKGSGSLESNYRKVGKKVLDLHLPADEYIDSDEGPCMENERVTEVPHLPAYPLNGSSKVMCVSDEKPYGINSNGFSGLNVHFKSEEAASKSYDLGGPTHHRNYPFNDLSRTTKLDSQALPNDVVRNLNKSLEACSDNPQLNQKKHEQLSRGQIVGALDSFRSSRHVCQPWTEAKFASGAGVSSAQAQGFTSDFLLVSGDGRRMSGISPAELWTTPVSDCGQSSTAVHASTFVSSSALFVQSSKSTMQISALNLNLNITPAECFDTTEFQSIQIASEEQKFQDSVKGLPWLKDKPACKGIPSEESKISIQVESVLKKSCNAGGIHGLKLKKIEVSDLSTEKTLALHCNEKPSMSSDLQPCHVFSSDVFPKQPKNQRIEEIMKAGVSDVESPCIDMTISGKQISAAELMMKNEQKQHKSIAGIIDLNSCMIEDENMSTDVDFQPPASPENKECSPPRGESDENQLDVPFQLAGQEDPEVLAEQFRVAAEALVSISGFVAHNGLHMTTCSSSVSSASNPLHWFAEIASTTADHPENETNNLEEFFPDGMDYFEFITLNLDEIKVSDCCCKSISSQTLQEGGGSTPPDRTRKGRVSMGRCRKDFQSEILPSLASLSRYEATEDLQTIGGLVAAASPSETASLRSAGKNAPTRGRKRSFTSTTSNNTDLHMNLKQLTSITRLSTEKRFLVSWGKTCKRKRSHRVPTTNYSQVYFEPKYIADS